MPPESITDPYAAAIMADLLALLPPRDTPIIDEAAAYITLARREHPEELGQLKAMVKTLIRTLSQ